MPDPNWRDKYRDCPRNCPWGPHPESPDDFERCTVQWCQITRPNPNRPTEAA